MGTTLTGTTPQDTYDSLIKVTDNGPLSGTAKYLSDGLGNDSALAVSTAAVGIGTASPNAPLEVQADSGGTSIRVKGRAAANSGTIRFFNNASSTQLAKIESSDNSFEIGSVNNVYAAFLTNGTEQMRITSAGNVGIGTSNPTQKVHVAGSNAGMLITGTVNTSGVQLSVREDGQDVQLLNNANGNLRFYTNGNEVGRFLAGGGLTFNGDTAAANALDDYEEGTWTPVYAGGITGATYLNTAGKYTKIGRVVHWSCRIQASAGTAAATALTIGGFPFTNSATVETAGSIAFFSVYTSQSAYIYNEPNTTNIAAFYNIDATPLLGTELTDVTGTIHCSGTYFV